MRRLRLTGMLMVVLGLVASSCTATGGDNSPQSGGDGPESEGRGGSASGETSEAVIPSPGAGTTVVSARATWSTGYFQNAVVAALLAELGYEVTDPAENEFPPGNGYAALAQGDVDYWADGWFPSHQHWLEPLLTNGTSVRDNVDLVGQLLTGSGLEGFLITRTVSEANGIKTLQQINDDPTLVALFDRDENGLAEIFGCPEEWTCDDVADATIRRNSWTNLELRQDPYETMVAETIARVADGEPVIQYTWSPSSHLAELRPGDNVKWLSLGSIDSVCDGADPCKPAWDFRSSGSVSLGMACTQDPCITGWPAASIHVTANREFLASNAPAATLLALISIDVEDVVAFAVRYNSGENSEDDVRALAAQWIADNRALVEGWLLEAAEAK